MHPKYQIKRPIQKVYSQIRNPNPLKQIEYHFNHYKDLKKPGSTEVKSFDGVAEAKKIIKAAIDRFVDEHPAEKAKASLKDLASGAKEAFKEISNK